MILSIATALLFLGLPQSDSLESQVFFLEGFPSVPLLDGFREVADSTIVFDTVAGTIAQVTLETELENGLVMYSRALEGLGYDCAANTGSLTCDKPDYTIAFRTLEAGVFELKASPKSAAS